MIAFMKTQNAGPQDDLPEPQRSGYWFEWTEEQKLLHALRVLGKYGARPSRKLRPHEFDEVAERCEQITNSVRIGFRERGLSGEHFDEPAWDSVGPTQEAQLVAQWNATSAAVREALGSFETFRSWYLARTRAFISISMLQRPPNTPMRALDSRGDYMNKRRGAAIRELADLSLDIVFDHCARINRSRRWNRRTEISQEEFVIDLLTLADCLERGNDPRGSVADLFVHSPPTPSSRKNLLDDAKVRLDDPIANKENAPAVSTAVQCRKTPDPGTHAGFVDAVRKLRGMRGEFPDDPPLQEFLDCLTPDSGVTEEVGAAAEQLLAVFRRLRDTLDDFRDDAALCAETVYQVFRRRDGAGAHGNWSRRSIAAAYTTTSKRMEKRQNRALAIVRDVVA